MDTLNNEFTYNTGSFSVLNEDIDIELNDFGEYKSSINRELSEKEIKKLNFININSDESLNEFEISKMLFNHIPNINYDKRVGYYKETYAGHVLEGDYRERASSGGFGTWIFKELLERKLIDGVIHVKENKDKDSSILFNYEISTSINEIREGSKTRYYPVEFSKAIKKIKEKEGKFAIIGTPEFIMSIRLLALQDPIVNDRIKYTIGLICGHQKSSKFADCLAWQVGIKPGNLKKIDFRKKLDNMPSNRYGVEMTGIKDGQEITIVKSMSELIGHDWGQGFFKSQVSDYTDDVMNETADITLGDAWLPEYTGDSKGNNIILVRNETIYKILEEGILEKKVNLDKINIDKVIKSQASHFQHTQNELSYRLFLKDEEKKWRPKKRIESSKKLPYFRKKIQESRMEISMKSHIIFNEAVNKNDFDYFVKQMSIHTKKYNKLYFLHNEIKKGYIKFIISIIKKTLKRRKV